ncbi:MAG: GGDEF domain-containing protein, partial [Gemmatimonadales bacterium]
KTIKIEAVSNGVDKRLKDLKIVGDSAVGRASMGDAPIVGHSARELFGAEHEDRRRNEEHGIAVPVRDGRDGVGALVVFGTVEGLDPGLRERVMWMALDAGPRLASAIAVRAAERRAMTDELTGLPNRRGLERVTSASPQLPCSILAVDLDHFKRVNDTFGHAAGDDALKHFSRILTHTLRDGDLAARIGGEEFAVWLPRTDRSSALEVAERLRYTAEERTWKWAGSEISITCSIGVASCPESVSQVANLGTTADAALYRAKELGRNRVESA